MSERRFIPAQRVVRTGFSPMNPRVKWAELACGHTLFMPRRPAVGKVIGCEKCATEDLPLTQIEQEGK